MKKINIRRDIFFIILCVYKFSFYGFFYLPYLDDYVQYILYPSIENPMKTILFGGAGAAFTRPLAAVLDIYFWSFFSGNFSAALIFLSILYAVSGVLFFKALKIYGFNPSPLFLAFYAFLPTLTEGTFWISAATRIVPALLFTSVSAYAMHKSDNTVSRVLFFLSNLFSLFFYEQISILSFCVTALVFLKKPKKFFIHFLLAVLNIFLFAAYYLCFGKNGDNADRLAFSAEILQNFKNNFLSLAELAITKQIPLYTKGFLRGVRLVMDEGAYFWLFVLGVLCFFMSFYCEKNKKCTFKVQGKQFLIGAILFSAPLMPFFVLENPWLNFRNLVPSVLGLALMTDAMLGRLLGHIKSVVFIVSLYLIICNVSEVADYTKTMVHDCNIIYSIAKNPEKDRENPNIYYYPETDKEENYLTQNSPYNDHIMSITGSDWGLTGTVRAVTKNRDITVLRN